MEKIRSRISSFTGYKVAASSYSSSIHENLGTRVVCFNLPLAEQVSFPGNKISTGKYTFLTFLPLFLYAQFRKAFNIFFLIISILQQIPGVSPTGRYTTIVPLIIILCIAALKEIIEDYKRHRQDDAVNNRLVEVFRDGRFIELKWTQVVVGDVVRVVSGKFFPADLVLLSSSEPQAMCYIETANLDGETNLKIRQGLPLTADIQSSEDLRMTCGRIECEDPNRNLYQFNGNISLKGDSDRRLPISNNQILLRGAMLRNTQWAYGVVVYTGHDSKLMKNSNRAPLKMSNVDRTTNTQIWIIFVILIVISLGSAVGSLVWKNMRDGRWYLDNDDVTVGSFFLDLLTFIILYNNLVPISLLVTLEMVKFIQAIFINTDVDMYYDKTDTPAMARTSNLNEELGQVQYIFSDKTGTLTRNQMLFKKCTVAGVKYGIDDNDKFDVGAFTAGFINTNSKGKHLRQFSTMLSVCHTVVPERADMKSDLSSSRNDVSLLRDIEYQSSSPDEAALVEAARSFGYVFVKRTPNHVTIAALGKETTYEVLNVLEFTSTRKRMSVIVRSPDGAIVLFCKGADDVIYERLTEDSFFQSETEEHLKEFAREGLRTLCFAYTTIDEESYNRWNENQYHPACTAVNGREEALSKAYNAIEKNLRLVGASAIEDKLQGGVPEAIATFKGAGIKLWVLTGDKQETAVNIAYSCHLFTDDMKLVYLNQLSTEETRDVINEELNQIGSVHLRKENDIGLVVAGATLKLVTSFDLRSSFLDLALSCKAVVCCRVSPMQKAEVVDLIKAECKAITLAIGDGANDVSMIQSAHVGVGISGCEGLQAANSSDYSIAQFEFLQKLLLVHGSWNYTRLTKCILFSFYKNICLYLIELWFVFFNGYSGQILFDRWTIALYNVLFTSLPPIALGLFERPCSSENMLKYPQLYSITQRALKYNVCVFWSMFLNATVHSAMLFFMSGLALRYGIAFENGKTGGYLFLGNFVYTYVVVTVSLKAGLESSTWTVFTHIAIWGSIIGWFLFFLMYSYFFPTLPVGEAMVGMANNVLVSSIFWFGLLLIPATVLFRDLLWKVLRRKFMKTVVEEVQELEADHIDPSQAIDAASFAQSLNEAAYLLKDSPQSSARTDQSTSADLVGITLSPFDARDRSTSVRSCDSGYAFSQEENGVVSQSDLIRRYDSQERKPNGR